jgi:hypothetical protein
MFATIAKRSSILGILKSNDFSEVIKEYYNKVYQAKLTKFGNNYILKNLNKNQLELLVHNAV